MQKKSSWEEHRCKEAKHRNAPINLVCLESNCQSHRKCCIYCIDDSHRKHHVISIERFLSELKENLQRNNNNPEKSKLYSLVKEARDFLQSEIEKIRSSFETKLTEAENIANSYLGALEESLGLSKHQTIEAHLLKCFDNQTINEYLQLLNKSKKLGFGTFKETKKMLEFSKEVIEERISQCDHSIREKLQQLKTDLNLVNLTGRRRKEDQKYSIENKSESLNVSDSGLSMKRVTGSTDHSLNLFSRPLDPINNYFVVRVDKCQSNRTVWLGVCLLDEVKKRQFKMCNGYKKGTYAIDQSVGYSYSGNNDEYGTMWNHSVQKMNSTGDNKNIGWNFKKGDILLVYVDFHEEQIMFALIDQEVENIEEQPIFSENFTMPIKINEGDLYPFVGTNSLNDEVSILEEETLNSMPWFQDWVSWSQQSDEQEQSEADDAEEANNGVNDGENSENDQQEDEDFGDDYDDQFE